jgi:hypothetical protein
VSSLTSRNLFASPAVLLITLVLAATSAFASGPYVIGSANPVTADPNVPRPSTKPCIVQILNAAEFANFNPVSFTYTPPADCPGPWAKVVFTADINVTAGIQYDRTANFWLGGTNIYFGTTAEPSPTLAPSWHVESDLTDYTPLFMTAQQGTADIGNLVNSTYTGIIFATSTLEFYPLRKHEHAPVTADVIVPLSAGPTGGTVGLGSTSSTLSTTFTPPTNIEQAYLDVYSQSQSNDEFWYTCVPNDVASELFSCGNTGFRETEIAIDGQPAGVAPVSPWIYSGGIDPWLWFPIPGVQTLNFIPYRVNLTPFAALLSNGQPHTVSLSVFNADNYFSDTASLLLYLDPDSAEVTGALTKNTLSAAPSPVVTENLNAGSTITGTVDVTSNRGYVLSGYVNTSHGRVSTTLAQKIRFANDQSFNITNTLYVQDITLASDVYSQTQVSRGDDRAITYTQNFHFPLTLDISQVTQSNGNTDLTTTAKQTYQMQNYGSNGDGPLAGFVTNTGEHQDTLEFDPNFNLLGNSNQSASQHYFSAGSDGNFYDCALQAANNVLTKFTPTCVSKPKGD